MDFIKKIASGIGNFFSKTIPAKFKAAIEAIKKDPKIIVEKTRTITFALIILVMAFAGIMFILRADQELTSKMWKVTEEIKKIGETDRETGEPVKVSQGVLIGQSKSLALMIAIILSFGAAVLSVFSEHNKSNKPLVFILKGIALVLVAGFIFFVMKFDGWYLTARGIKTFAEFKTMPIIIGGVGAGLIVINIVTNVWLGIED